MNPRNISDTGLLQELVVELFNQVGELKEELASTQKQFADALDEIKRLKGEKGRPRFRSSKKAKTKPDSRSNSQEDRTSAPDAEDKLPPVNRVECIDTKPNELPDDAVFKGYRSVYQRDIRIVPDHIEYRIARWYSPRTGKVYEAPLPSDYNGQIGSKLTSFIQMLHHCGDMTHRRISDLLKHIGIRVSTGGISNILTYNDWICSEQAALLSSSIEASPYVQMDSTTTKEQGKRMYTQVICGQYFSLFYTQAGRSRLDVYASLQGQSRQTVQLAYNKHAHDHMIAARVSQKHRAYFKQHYALGQVISMQELEAVFNTASPFRRTNQSRRSIIAGTLAAGYYDQQDHIPSAAYILTDDAKEYRRVPSYMHAHCWIHAIRHYRVMNPRIAYHRSIYDDFMGRLWAFYERLKQYKHLTKQAQKIEKRLIGARFDKLFNAQTDYNLLNKQMAMTKSNRPQLLACLEYPELPLHNNAAERGARRIVRKRDISYHTWSKRGTSIRDAFISLHQTANKLGISFLDYLVDRNSGADAIQSLAIQVKNAYQ